MSSITRHIHRAALHPLRNGFFVVFAVLMAGSIVGMIVGFGNPMGASAQVIPGVADVVVTGYMPTPGLDIMTPPPTAITIQPFIPPMAVVPVTTVGTGNTKNTNSKDDVVVTAKKDSDTPQYGSPCCDTSTVGNTTPAVGGDVVVTAHKNDDTPEYGSPCCTTPGIEIPEIPVYGSPCCTVPEIPIIPIIPEIPEIPITPIIPPPSGPQAGCTLLSSSSEIASGAAITLTWQTSNTDSITIAPNVGTFSTATSSSGTTVVYPTVDTTYVGTVSNGTQSVHCQVPVHVTTTTVTKSSSCTYLQADAATIPANGAVVLTWQTKDAASVTITDNTGAVIATSTDATGTVTVHPTVDSIYSAQVPGESIKAACQAPVTITTGGGGCTSNCGGGGCTTNCGGGGGGCSGSCGGGGGGSPTPRVFFNSISRQVPPLSSVYLSQIPYTGLDLGPVGTIVYWLMLVIWSLAAAYLVLFGGLPAMRRKFSAFGSSVRDTLQNDLAPVKVAPAHEMATSSHQAIHEAAVAYAMPDVSKPAVVHAAPAPSAHGVQYATIAPSRAEMTGQGFKAFAQGGALTIDDIVKGLSRESGMDISTEAPVPVAAPAHVEEVVMEAPVEHSAYPEPIIPAMPRQAPTPSPRAQAPAKEAPIAAPVHAEVPGFITAILNGERDAVFGVIRSMNQAGHDVEDFMAQAICALDDAYRARIDGTPVHSDVKLVTDGLATPFLERLVTSLTTAVDGSYSMGVTGIKLALTRALAVSQG